MKQSKYLALIEVVIAIGKANLELSKIEVKQTRQSLRARVYARIRVAVIRYLRNQKVESLKLLFSKLTTAEKKLLKNRFLVFGNILYRADEFSLAHDCFCYVLDIAGESSQHTQLEARIGKLECSISMHEDLLRKGVLDREGYAWIHYSASALTEDLRKVDLVTQEKFSLRIKKKILYMGIEELRAHVAHNRKIYENFRT